MESKILGRSVVVDRKKADQARDIIDTFVRVGGATIVDEQYYGAYVEFVIDTCDESVFRGIVSDLMVENIELF